MEYQSTAKYMNVSPRKMRLVADAIRGMKPIEVVSKLSATSQRVRQLMATVVAAAIANATQKQVKPEDLRFKAVEIMEGPARKRWHAVSRGMAHSYKKRMTHVRVILTDESKE